MAWAFWEYDTPPYFLGDKIASYNTKTNIAELQNFGGMNVKPVIIINNDKEGLKKWLEIKNIGDSISLSISILKEGGKRRSEKILDQYK